MSQLRCVGTRMHACMCSFLCSTHGRQYAVSCGTCSTCAVSLRAATSLSSRSQLTSDNFLPLRGVLCDVLWRRWVREQIAKMPVPANDPAWTKERLKSRDSVETTTHNRISKVPPLLPHWSELGYKKLKMPEGLHKEMLEFYKKCVCVSCCTIALYAFHQDQLSALDSAVALPP